MIKKKYFIWLSILLLVLLSVSSATIYAKELSPYDIANFCYNSVNDKMAEGTNKQNALNNISSMLTDEFIDASNIISENQGNYIIAFINGFLQIGVYKPKSNGANYHAYYYNGAIQFNSNYWTGRNYRWELRNRDYTTNTTTTVGTTNNDYYFYTDLAIYTSAQGNVKWTAGTYKPDSNIFIGPYEEQHSYFDVTVVYGISGDYEINFNGITINDVYLVDKYNYNGIYTFNNYYGLVDETTLDTLDMIVVDNYKYNLYTKRWVQYNQVSYINFSGEHFYYDSEFDVLVFADNQIGDTISLVTFEPNDLIEASPIQFTFYWQSSLTQFSGSSISPDGTFSDPNYYHDYNNQIDVETQSTDSDKIIANQNQNTQDIINTLDNPEVDDEYLGEFNGYFSGDADTISHKFGFLTFPNDVYNDIYLFLNDLFAAIIDDNDVYFDFSLHGETPTRIYSHDIYVPNGVLKSFISVFLVACTVYVIYLKFFNYYEMLCSGNISTLINDFDIDKSIFRM